MKGCVSLVLSPSGEVCLLQCRERMREKKRGRERERERERVAPRSERNGSVSKGTPRTSSYAGMGVA